MVGVSTKYSTRASALSGCVIAAASVVDAQPGSNDTRSAAERRVIPVMLESLINSSVRRGKMRRRNLNPSDTAANGRIFADEQLVQTDRHAPESRPSVVARCRSCRRTPCAGRFGFRPSTGSGHVVAVSLEQPVYPPIAVSARVAGDVRILLTVRPDGGIESAETIAGPPLLREAAEKALRASRFECRDCGGDTVSHVVLFSFTFDRPAPDWNTDLVTHVRITAKSPILQIYFSSSHVYSVKCLYLWRCGSQWGGMDYYYYRARSGRCAWLWNCGWRPRK